MPASNLYNLNYVFTITSTYISFSKCNSIYIYFKCDLQFCKSRQCFVLKQVQYYKYCFCIFSLSFLIFWGQGFVEVPQLSQLLKSVSSFTYRIVNHILRFVSRYVSNRYTPSSYINYFLSYRASTHTHTHTHTHTDSDEYSIVAFCKNATIITSLPPPPP